MEPLWCDSAMCQKSTYTGTAASVISPPMPPAKPIFAVVLAAGRSERFGSTKLIAELRWRSAGTSRPRGGTRSCIGENVLLIAGHEADRIVDAAGDEARFIVVNEDFASGMGTSIAAAVRVLAHRADAILLVLADQALITASHLQALCRRLGRRRRLDRCDSLRRHAGSAGAVTERRLQRPGSVGRRPGRPATAQG